ncbi:MAG: NADH-quinone oxidoreductase subunit NuoE [Bacteroidales bacterium]|jgi:NADH-quinone oxidoreductase subunit E|nr:NADH-quinone oxidoreductase subunit NuoE [Bacteroidales bacterium]
MREIEKILDQYPFVQRDNLIPILQEIQKNFGYISEEAIVRVGNYLKMPTSKIYGLATFYNQFRFIPKGNYHIKICNGTSCHVNANQLIVQEVEKILGIKSGENTRDNRFSLETTSCMGVCGRGPVMAINHKYFTELTVSKVRAIIKDYQQRED